MEWLMPMVEYSTVAYCMMKVLVALDKIALMPAQWPGMGDAELEVKVMGLSAVPVALREPLMMSSHLEVSLPPSLSSNRAVNFTVVPGWIVRVIPAGTVTSPVTVTTPDHTSSVRSVPEVVMVVLSMVTVTPALGTSATSLLSMALHLME